MKEIKQLNKDQAIAIFESKLWKNWTKEQIVQFQLFQNRLAVPFDKFHEAIEFVLKRPVCPHEFTFKDNIINEYLGKKKQAPTFDEIINLIPEEKRIIIFADKKH